MTLRYALGMLAVILMLWGLIDLVMLIRVDWDRTREGVCIAEFAAAAALLLVRLGVHV